MNKNAMKSYPLLALFLLLSPCAHADLDGFKQAFSDPTTCRELQRLLIAKDAPLKVDGKCWADSYQALRQYAHDAGIDFQTLGEQPTPKFWRTLNPAATTPDSSDDTPPPTARTDSTDYNPSPTSEKPGQTTPAEPSEAPRASPPDMTTNTATTAVAEEPEPPATTALPAHNATSAYQPPAAPVVESPVEAPAVKPASAKPPLPPTGNGVIPSPPPVPAAPPSATIPSPAPPSSDWTFPWEKAAAIVAVLAAVFGGIRFIFSQRASISREIDDKLAESRELRDQNGSRLEEQIDALEKKQKECLDELEKRLLSRVEGLEDKVVKNSVNLKEELEQTKQMLKKFELIDDELQLLQSKGNIENQLSKLQEEIRKAEENFHNRVAETEQKIQLAMEDAGLAKKQIEDFLARITSG